MEIIASSPPRERIRLPGSVALNRMAWLLVAGSPILFALITWPIPAFTQQGSIRQFSLPILVVEFIVIVLAMRDGFQPGQTMAAAPRWVKATLALLTAVAIGTALVATPDRAASILRTSNSIVHLLFALSVGHLFAGPWRSLETRVWPSIAIGTLGYGLILVVYVASIADPKTYEWVFFQLAVTHVRQLGFYSVVGACAALGLALTSASKRGYWAWLAVAAAMIAMSFWSGTRSSLVALAGAYVIGLLAFPSLRRARAWGGLLFSTFTGLALALLHQVPHPAFGPLRLWVSSQSDDPGSGRLEIWLGTLRVWLDRPLFGYGESQFRWLVPEVEGTYNHPHNLILQILFQWGLVGAACYFALAAFLWFRFERAVRHVGAAALPAYLVAVSLLVYSLFEGSLFHPYPITMLAIAIVWVLAGGSAAKVSVGPPAR